MQAYPTLDSVTRARILSAVVLAIGLTLAGVWTNTVGYSVQILPLGAEPIIGIPSADAFRFGRLFTGVLFIVFARKFPKAQNTAVIVAALALCMGTGSLVIAYHQTLLDAQLLSLLSIFAAIACYSFLVWVFYRQFARRLPAIYAVWGISASLVLELWLSAFVCLSVLSEVQIVLSLLIPFLIAAVYFVAYRFDAQNPDPKPFPRVSRKSEKYSLIAQVILITVALVFIQALSEAGTWGESRGTYAGSDEFAPVQLAVVAAIVLALTLLVFHAPRRRLSLSLRCIIGFGVSLMGLQILALINDLGVDPRLAPVAVAIEAFAHLVRWLMVIECVSMVSMPSYRVAGIAHVASALVGLLGTHLVSEMAFGNSALVMVTIYLLLMSVIVVFVRGYYSQSTRLWATEGRQDDGSAKRFAEEHSLSPREREIFALLIQGLKYIEIEQSCSLSSGTVKTHVSNLYKKLDVHSRKEMRDLYNRYRSDG
ncbi:MAG: LuxR C-terminal-related transcriptional regulator [Coriobacteriales bacterium]|jgi:DNA-binding CsgD family transcriptional regulator|nr:LuxR C-terminal-related transcriptional regulator [Coriobacteriales bacterium]